MCPLFDEKAQRLTLFTRSQGLTGICFEIHKHNSDQFGNGPSLIYSRFPLPDTHKHTTHSMETFYFLIPRLRGHELEVSRTPPRPTPRLQTSHLLLSVCNLRLRRGSWRRTWITMSLILTLMAILTVKSVSGQLVVNDSRTPRIPKNSIECRWLKAPDNILSGIRTELI